VETPGIADEGKTPSVSARKLSYFGVSVRIVDESAG
jgi:hypothetical protein